ncbi:hypothetical protein PENSPDRAFT_645891 [Peniophora sp. CONT]|nr:hypothetical protein PENSPDRAFT_645891 [Peniophora sp. CONT]
MARLILALTTIFAAHSALAAPFSRDILFERDTTPSFNLTQNALDAQALNSIFGAIDANSSCSGQFDNDMACVSNNVAVCQNGKWQTLDQCGQFQCLALPVMAGNGTTVSCTSATFADEVFQQLGVPGGFNSTTAANISTVAFPTLASNTTNAANATDASGDDSDEGDDEDCDDEDAGDDATSAPTIVTQTIVVTVTATPSATPSITASEEPATTVVLSQASASAIIASIQSNGGTVVTSIAHKHKTASTTVPTSTEIIASTAAPTSIVAVTSSAASVSATPTKSILILNPAASASASA